MKADAGTPRPGCWRSSQGRGQRPRDGSGAQSQGHGSEADLELNGSQRDAAKNNINRPLRDGVTILRGGFRQGREFRDRLVIGT